VAKKAGITPVASNRARVPVLLDGREVSRAEAIRALSAEGMTVGKIAKELGCTYQTVYQTVKKVSDAATTIEAQLAETEGVEIA
jgi:transposase